MIDNTILGLTKHDGTLQITFGRIPRDDGTLSIELVHKIAKNHVTLNTTLLIEELATAGNDGVINKLAAVLVQILAVSSIE